MRRVLTLLLGLALALALPPWPAVPCGYSGDQPWYAISPGDNPQFVACPADAPPATPAPSPAPADYPVRVWLPVALKG